MGLKRYIYIIYMCGGRKKTDRNEKKKTDRNLDFCDFGQKFGQVVIKTPPTNFLDFFWCLVVFGIILSQTNRFLIFGRGGVDF